MYFIWNPLYSSSLWHPAQEKEEIKTNNLLLFSVRSQITRVSFSLWMFGWSDFRSGRSFSSWENPSSIIIPSMVVIIYVKHQKQYFGWLNKRIAHNWASQCWAVHHFNVPVLSDILDRFIALHYTDWDGAAPVRQSEALPLRHGHVT